MVKITSYNPALGEAIEKLQRVYIAAHPKGTKFISKEFFNNNPALEQGANVLCAHDRKKNMVGYGALFPSPAEADSPSEIPNTIWIHIRVDPTSDDFCFIREQLYNKMCQRAAHYGNKWDGRKSRIAISYPESLEEEISFFRQMGFKEFNALVQMSRDLTIELPKKIQLPGELAIRQWNGTDEGVLAQYATVEAQIFQHDPRTVDELRFYFQSWESGTPFTAFDQTKKIVGSVMAYWYGNKYGITEDIFVIPEWRGQGIAKYLICEGLQYLARNGIEQAGLEVKESNVPACQLYSSLGYEIHSREEQWELEI